MRRTVPLIITFVVGCVLIIPYFVPKIEDWREDASVWFDLLAGFAFILGGGNLLKLHGERVYRRRRGWGFSLVAIVSFLVTLTVGLAMIGVKPNPNYPNASRFTGTYDQKDSAFYFAYASLWLLSPLGLLLKQNQGPLHHLGKTQIKSLRQPL